MLNEPRRWRRSSGDADAIVRSRSDHGAASREEAERTQSIPGIALSATAIAATVPSEGFRSGRDFAADGLVLRKFNRGNGGWADLETGDRYLRRILVVGAVSVRAPKPEKFLAHTTSRENRSRWSRRLPTRCCIAWAVLKGGSYRAGAGDSGVKSRQWSGCVRAFKNCRGDDDIDAKRSRPSIGKTRFVPREERARAFVWDPISGLHQGQRP
jgi:hypothetical protein